MEAIAPSFAPDHAAHELSSDGFFPSSGLLLSVTPLAP
jgi:hypothetical protein